jgi:DNA-binding NarL/FixJ family response regulator
MHRANTVRETTVLIVSAQPALVALLHAEMESLGRFRLRSVARLDAVEWLVREEDYDLIIVDMEGNVDSARLSRLLETRTSYEPPFSVLALSETYRTEEAIAVLSLGAADYLSWADHREKIASVITNLIEAPVHAPQVAQVESLRRPLPMNA